LLLMGKPKYTIGMTPSLQLSILATLIFSSSSAPKTKTSLLC
jgi:hypothetical protein